MITHPCIEDIPLLKKIWKDVFLDIDEYIDLFFEDKFSVDSALIYKVKGKIVSMIYFPSYSMKFYSAVFSTGYICGAATLPAFRGKGIMGLLLKNAFEVMKKRGDVFSVLIPANEKLYHYYQSFGYETVFYKKRASYIRNNVAGKEIRLNKVENASDIMPIYERAISEKKIVVLQTLETYKSVFKDYQAAKGDVFVTEEKDAYCFVLRFGEKLIVKELFAKDCDIDSLVYTLFLRYPDVKTIIINEPSSESHFTNAKLTKAGMATVLNKKLAVEAYEGKLQHINESRLVKTLFDKKKTNPYLNMMLN